MWAKAVEVLLFNFECLAKFRKSPKECPPIGELNIISFGRASMNRLYQMP